MQVLIEEFLNYLKVQKNYSINTITNYQRDLLLFNEYLEKESLSFKDLEYQDIRLFYNYMDLKNYNKNTMCRILSSIRSFYKYLSRNNYILFYILKYYQYINLLLFVAVPLIAFTAFSLRYKKK